MEIGVLEAFISVVPIDEDEVKRFPGRRHIVLRFFVYPCDIPAEPCILEPLPRLLQREGVDAHEPPWSRRVLKLLLGG